MPIHATLAVLTTATLAMLTTATLAMLTKRCSREAPGLRI
jgi:hypothetical protein